MNTQTLLTIVISLLAYIIVILINKDTPQDSKDSKNSNEYYQPQSSAEYTRAIMRIALIFLTIVTVTILLIYFGPVIYRLFVPQRQVFGY